MNETDTVLAKTDDAASSHSPNTSKSSIISSSSGSGSGSKVGSGRKVLLQRIVNLFLVAPIRFLILPYIAGLIWHGLHPFASVLTGDMEHARRWYIDENSLDPNHFQVHGNYDMILQTQSNSRSRNNHPLDAEQPITSLCHGILMQQKVTGINIPCHQYSNEGSYQGSFEIAKIVPLAAGIVPVSEAIVLVIPPFLPFVPQLYRTSQNNSNDPIMETEKSRAQFQASILQFIRRMASPQITPWLSKTIFIVAPYRPLAETHNSTDTIPPTPMFASSSSSSSSMAPILESTVNSFLDVYLGKNPFQSRRQEDQRLYNTNNTSNHDHSTTTTTITATTAELPFHYLGCILRHILVLDLELFVIPSADGNNNNPNNNHRPSTVLHSTNHQDPNYHQNEIRILPQGRRGVLPNMDLVFLVKFILERSNMVSHWQQLSLHNTEQYQLVDIVVHPYRQQVESYRLWITEQISIHGPPYPILLSMVAWIHDLLPLLAFESVLALGPYPPHAPALERGIDAITIQGYFAAATDADDFDLTQGNTPRTKLSPQQYPMELVQRMELIVRSLSNLHERLHHSTSLYLLPSKDRFVKHEEYLVPNLLLIIPLIMRAIHYVLLDRTTTQESNPSNFFAVGQAFIITLIWTIMVSLLITADSIESDLDESVVEGSWLVRTSHSYRITGIYVVLLWMLTFCFKRTLLCPNSRRCIQFASCLLASFMHVSIAFGHVSLAYPSALFWTLLLAFPTYRNVNASSGLVFYTLTVLYKVGVFLITCPFTYLVPGVFSVYTPYVRYIYVPLHLLFCIQHILPSFVRSEHDSEESYL
jgi:Gaa1-like, GPI transamidase component